LTKSFLPHHHASIMSTHPDLSRRSFVKSASASLAAPFIFPQMGWPANANSRVQHACIGVGGMMGGNDFKNFMSHGKTDVVAMVDVDQNALAGAVNKNPNGRKYTDWREMLAKEGDKIDSLNATVPDHMHAMIALQAIQKKKHVYVQKPLCHDVAEVRALNEASAKMGVVTQLGTQHASGAGDRMAVQWVRDGLIGKVKKVILCSNRASGMAYRLEGPRPAQGSPPPEGLDWDLWVGTAPMRPFAPDIYHPAKWRAWLDFGTGWSGDIGSHIFDAVWKGLGLGPCTSVVAEVDEAWKNSPARRADTWSRGNHITWEFSGNERTEGNITLEWFDGDQLYPSKADTKVYTDPATGYGETKYPEEAAMLIGTEGTLVIPHGRTYALLHPKSKFAQIPKPKFEPRNHYHHFLDAILGTAKNESHFQQTGPMSEAGTKFTWDHASMKTNLPAADQLLRRNYRDGWKVEGLG
jgi:predicted dehydrogenase